MSLPHNIPLFSILFVLLSAFVLPFFKEGRGALHFVRAVQLIVGVLSAILLIVLCRSGQSFTYMLGHVPAPWGNELRAGPLEALLALVFSLIMLLSMTGGGQDIIRDIPTARRGGFCLLMQLLYAALLVMIYTNDLFTAYVFIELTAITACIAVVAKETGPSVVAAIRYLIFSCLASGLILMGISILYSITGHLLMEHLHIAIKQLVETGAYGVPLMASSLLLALGLAIKSAQFPFHAWLPSAHANATTAASAILSGLVLKGYIILLLKLSVRVFGGAVLVELFIHELLFLLGLSGMLVTSLLALRQEGVKQMIAYSSAAQISYIFLALGLGTTAGMAAACFQLIAHAVTKPMIFIGAGVMLRTAGTGHHWSDLRGIARSAPMAGAAFTVGALSLCSLPLLAGFSAKYTLAVAALSGGWHAIITLMALAVSSVLNALYYIPAILVIWGRRDPNQAVLGFRGDPTGYRVAIVCFVACNVALGVGVGPMMELINLGLRLF